ncbi:uncharacterized protein LOC130654339 isoform X2 [Hydractinia symbiolongicarpus]|uniref:uncharacterized protein LOC130654339 isoform X2 n=1 Tax=Hydractinia symbiolongicarpus TaxID=13093 RepID=UPI00254DA96B|nr:uncharacterized protein LOC130654339 isoform X2 [Hydractinia symbiolongicarpus]
MNPTSSHNYKQDFPSSVLTKMPMYKSKPTNSPPPKRNGDSGDSNSTHIIIASTVCGVLFLVILLLLLLYCYKRRRDNQSHRNIGNKSNFHGVAKADQYKPPSPNVYSGFVYENEALQSSQVIEPGENDRNLRKPDQFTAKQEQTVVPSQDFEHNVSIKLMTPWNEIYIQLDSKEYQMMKSYTVESIADLYLNFDGFKSTTLLRFRQGSVIADLNLKFAAGTTNALERLKQAVLRGQCSQLQVDTDFFSYQPAVASKTNDVRIETEALCLNANNHSISGSLTRSDRMESGYGSQYFDPSAVAEKLQNPKVRDSSQKSTDSIESGTSEIGTSHSISPKSCSSTNVSVHSNVDEEPPKREKVTPLSFIQSIVKKKTRGSKTKQHATIGIPHIALFDFDPQDFRELALHQSDLVTVTITDEGGWVKATNAAGKEGWVPQNFVAPFDPKQYAETKNAVDSIMFLDGIIESIDTSSEDHHIGKQNRNSHMDDQKSDASDKSHDSPTDEIDISGLFIAIFPNDPVERNELRLQVGDLVDVLKTSETGWWKGRCLSTHEDGWFPSSYVQPQTSNLDFHKYLQDELDDKGTVSDSEVHTRMLSAVKKSREDENGYSSDTFPESDARSKGNSASRINVVSRAMLNSLDAKFAENLSDGDDSRYEQSSLEPVVSNRQEEDTDNEGSHHESGLTDPPSKPVPPKPRKRHMLHTYRNLAAEGKLGSTDSLVTRSTECLASIDAVGRSHHRKDRRNSEEINTDDVALRGSRFDTMKPIDRLRPRSFQETPKSNFFYLANRYASCMKPAWSLPTLVGDQVKLSPDDERPYLVPIPRKSRKKSSLAAVVVPKDDLGVVEKEQSVSLPNSPLKKTEESCASKKTEESCASEDLGINVDVNISAISFPRHRLSSMDSTRNVQTKSPSTIDKHIFHSSDSVTPLVSSKPAISPKPSIPPKPSVVRAKLIGAHEVQKPSLIGEKPTVPVRTTSKNIFTKAFINEQLSKSHENLNSSKLNEHIHSRPPHSNSRSRNNHRLFAVASFESINEESEQNSFQITTEDNRKNFKNDHRRYHSEPHEGSYNINTNEAIKEHLNSEPARESRTVASKNNLNSKLARENHSLASENHNTDSSTSSESFRMALPNNERVKNSLSEDKHVTKREVLNEQALRKHDRLTASSRTSSMQSLSSIASSRSTASSKHEQMNLRIAIMNVYGQGSNDLSFKAGAILYELRPRNKEGFCFGLLEDSKQGFYPAEAVQIFHEV